MRGHGELHEKLELTIPWNVCYGFKIDNMVRMKGNLLIMKKTIVIFGMMLCMLTTGVGWTREKKQKENPVYIVQTTLGNIEVELFLNETPKTVANFMGLAEGTKEFKDTKTGKQTKRPYYDGQIFHRVIKDFMLQTGCPLGNGRGGPGYTFGDEIDAKAMGLDKIKAFDPKKGPHPFLMIRSQEQFQQHIVMPLFRAMNIKSQKEHDERREEFQARLDKLTLEEAYENMGYVYSDIGSSHPPVRGSLAMANSGPNTNGSQFFINLVDTDWLTGKHAVFGRVVKGMNVVDKIGAVKVDSGNKPVEDVKIISIRRKTSQ
jgi:cyclophilin family peptidyl-prolyl cis-trans isomerase